MKTDTVKTVSMITGCMTSAVKNGWAIKAGKCGLLMPHAKSGALSYDAAEKELFMIRLCGDTYAPTVNGISL